jgi:HIV Tat-specific factor 1
MPAAPVLARVNKKRKEPVDYTSATPVSEAGPSIKRGRNDKSRATDKPAGERKSKNTAVYVTGLPLDAEVDELVERFSKCGVIEEDDDEEPKVKMYAKDDGSFSGDALVVYFKEDSVLLALNILDGAELRLGEPSTTMKVQKADFGHNTSTQSNDSGDAKPRRTVDKKKASKRIGKMQK